MNGIHSHGRHLHHDLLWKSSRDNLEKTDVAMVTLVSQLWFSANSFTLTLSVLMRRFVCRDWGGGLHVPGIALPSWRWSGESRCWRRRRGHPPGGGGFSSGWGSRTVRPSGLTAPGTSSCPGLQLAPSVPSLRSPVQRRITVYYRPRTYVRREVMFSQVCVCSGGGPRSRWGGVPGLKIFRGRGFPISDFFRGGTWFQIWGGGGLPSLRFLGGVYPVSDFWGGDPVSVKGKIFDTRFGLIHVQTGKKSFCQGTPPPSKGKNFYTRFGGEGGCKPVQTHDVF